MLTANTLVLMKPVIPSIFEEEIRFKVKICVSDTLKLDFSSNKNFDRKKCYACTATVDSQGRNIGVGDTTCFNIGDNTLTDDMLIDCKPDEEYCATEILADWEPKDSLPLCTCFKHFSSMLITSFTNFTRDHKFSDSFEAAQQSSKILVKLREMSFSSTKIVKSPA